ncbi:hypothetical protein L1987_44020 [Smallanthus sonchifolius]|uniref:Uncharacterized protein n=1 Tax=Smallanthus sonchifolius TaxID=185202 RepID=A0ACB9GNB5_9ASTR|nr:hypothetical protein L1987_44020 [Smallanthus sonchifolius]
MLLKVPTGHRGTLSAFALYLYFPSIRHGRTSPFLSLLSPSPFAVIERLKPKFLRSGRHNSIQTKVAPIMSELTNSNHRESDLARKESKDSGKNSTKPNLSTSSWTKLKDPRIVRVSRAFGGKDRHSKVCTVKGLRDRRVRLSVPTAIQLYDLQYRLGLDQPSKVVDWLLDVAKHEIDELPPLQMPPSFAQDLQSMINVASQSETLEGIKPNSNGINWEDYCNPNKSKEKDTFFVQSSDQSSSIPIMFNNVVPNGSFLNLNPSNLSLSRFGSTYRSMSSHQQEDASHNFNINVSGSHLLVYPPPSHDHNSRYLQFDPKQLNYELLSSSSHNPLASSPLYAINQGMIGPFHLSMNPNSLSEENEQDKGN